MEKPIVKIVWNDSQDHKDKWVDEVDAVQFGEELCEIISVGFLVSKTTKYITIAGDWDDVDKDYGRVTKIPMVWLVSITYLGGVDGKEQTEPKQLA